jgi:hypothetical protein
VALTMTLAGGARIVDKKLLKTHPYCEVVNSVQILPMLLSPQSHSRSHSLRAYRVFVLPMSACQHVSLHQGSTAGLSYY